MDADSGPGRLPPHILNPLLAKAPENLEAGVNSLLQPEVSRLLNVIEETAVPDAIHPVVIAAGQYRQNQLPVELLAVECQKVQKQLTAAYRRVAEEVRPAGALPSVRRETIMGLLDGLNKVVSSALALQQKETAPAVKEKPDMKLGDTRIWFRG